MVLTEYSACIDTVDREDRLIRLPALLCEWIQAHLRNSASRNTQH
jgi:hypothetical protein